MAAKNKGRRGLILIDDKYGIAVNERDYALVGIYVTKDGKEYTRAIAFYSSVAKCLKEYVRTCVHDALMDEMDISLAEALERIETAVHTSTQVISGVLPAIDMLNEQKELA